MSGQSTCSLSEALTAMAFSDPTPATAMSSALSDGRWGYTRDLGLAQLAKALHALCDAGYKGDIALWGKRVTKSPGETPHLDPLRRLTMGECLEHRRFVPGHDTLWKGENQGSEYEDSFMAHASPVGLGDVCVDLEEFNKHMATHGGTGTATITPTASPARFTDAEIDAWIGSTTHTSMKKARNAFMKELRAKGLSATFERRWNDIKQNPVGRPSAR